ncbi:MAG TPA: phosphotransferase [Alphaproteobacteria bacterium]
MQALLQSAGWADADTAHVTPDWSPRQYWRVTKSNGDSAIFLQGPIPDFRGHGLKDFVEIGKRISALGLSVPQIYASDFDKAQLLMEDFGSTAIEAPAIEKEGYETAIDALAVLRNAPTDGLINYEDGYIYKKLSLFSDDPQWMAAWKQIEDSLPPCPHVFSHMDYKAGNLFWLPERDNIKRLGILDYQAAQNAPFMYDCVILLEDARRTLPWDMKAHLKARYIAALPDAWKPIFDVWYPVIAAQFHVGVLGQIRGRANIDPDMPARLEAYLQDELQSPSLKSLYEWRQKTGLV